MARRRTLRYQIGWRHASQAHISVRPARREHHQRPVHPRVRGERLYPETPITVAGGSSPRSRGTAICSGGRNTGQRLIPAFAGNGASVRALSLGSSPRSRGTALQPRFAAGFGRFIPAFAGNGTRQRRDGWTRAVHPRVRGERDDVLLVQRRRRGSSPRSRGTGPRNGRPRRPWRFIPAFAGNGHSRTSAGVTISVHPRVRGERRAALSPACRDAGSSPRSRGTVRFRPFVLEYIRFIPAFAGNGSMRLFRSTTLKVHPRVRGERATASYTLIASAGSSPRSRGTEGCRSLSGAIGRFIPAFAGNGAGRTIAAGGRAVHPRVRGERSPSIMTPVRKVGSSPRSRGTGDPAAAEREDVVAVWVHPRVRGERTVRASIG